MTKVYSDMLNQIFSGYKGPNEDILRNIPEFFRLLQRIYISEGLGWQHKFKINACLSYFAIPDDVISDDDVERGYIDDLFICAYVLYDLLDEVPEIVRENWEGEEDIERLVEATLERTAEILGDLDRYILGLVGLLKFGSMDLRGGLAFDASMDKKKRAMVEDQIYSLKGLLISIYSYLGHDVGERMSYTQMKSLYSDRQWAMVVRILERLKSAEEVYDNSHEEEVERIRIEVLINIDKSIYM